MNFGDDDFGAFTVHLMPLLEKNYFETGNIMLEWGQLKSWNKFVFKKRGRLFKYLENHSHNWHQTRADV